MSEKKPAAGEWWGNANGDLVFIHGRTQFGALIVEEAGTVIDHWDWNWDGWHHEPACTGWDWQPETWPKYFEAHDTGNAFIRCERNGCCFVVRDDGSEMTSSMPFEYYSARKQLTKSEALARLNPPLPTCPDCGEPLTEGHADVCEMAWVVQDRVPSRPGIDERRWVSTRTGEGYHWQDAEVLSWPHQLSHGRATNDSVLELRCRRKDLPPVPEPENPIPTPVNLGPGFSPPEDRSRVWLFRGQGGVIYGRSCNVPDRAGDEQIIGEFWMRRADR